MSKLIILDANVIIVAHKFDFWKQLVSYYKIFVPSIILNESRYFKNTFDQKISIDLSNDIQKKLIVGIEASIADMNILYDNFKANFIESIDDGEQEALAILYSNKKTDILFCTGDMRAICALAIMEIAEKGISLEKVMNKAGIHKNIGKHFSELAFKTHLGRGFQEKGLHKKNK